MTRHRSSKLVFSIALCVSLSRCTEAALQPAESQELVGFDNRLDVLGEVCVQPDEKVDFPVKALFLIDQSASLQCTDSANLRFGALQRVIGELRSSPVARAGFVGFSSWARIQPFTRDRSEMAAFVDPSGGLGPATDYQGALATGLRLLEADIRATDPSERARTRYQVVFVSDGVPEPRCNAGCEDDERTCSDEVDNDGDGRVDADDPDCANIQDNVLHPDNLYGVCNTTEEIPDDAYVDMDGLCPAYNQPEQIMRRVAQLMELRDIYSLGSLQLHTVLLFSPQSVVEGVCPGAADAFGYDQAEARALLQAMAQAGEGTFRDVNLAASDEEFLDFDLRSLEAPQALSALSAFNSHAERVAGRLEPDSDADGLADVEEQALGSDLRRPDSDEGGGDGYGDLFEQRMASRGFDLLDARAPAIACQDPGDLDGDRLRDCEESILGTDPRRADTDDDGLADGLEVMAGTDPLRDDAREDSDLDGILNGDEVRGRTDPHRVDDDVYRASRVEYDLTELGRRAVGGGEERLCYQFEVRNLELVTAAVPGQRGLNRVLVQAHERPAQLGGAQGRMTIACFEALYRDGTTKLPASGVIDVTRAAWDRIAVELERRMLALESCAWFNKSPVDRADVLGALNACEDGLIPVGRFVYPASELEALVRKYLQGNGALALPEDPAQLFVPSERFEPERDCFRPQEVERVLATLQALADQCTECANDPEVSPCCR